MSNDSVIADSSLQHQPPNNTDSHSPAISISMGLLVYTEKINKKKVKTK